MAKCKSEISYRCNDDCRIEGCPTHKAELLFDSVTDYYFFKFDNQELVFEGGKMQAIINLLRQLDYRIELQDLLNEGK